MHTIGDHFPSPDPDPVIVDEMEACPEPPQDEPKAAAPTPTKSSSEKEKLPPLKPRGIHRPLTRQSSHWPDGHTVVQGLITYRHNRIEYVLAPWQLLPFSEGYEFLAEPYKIRYHRGVYHVTSEGEPIPEGDAPAEGLASRLRHARHSWAYVTPADSICGFSGQRYARSRLSIAQVQKIHADMTQDGVEDRPWSVESVGRTTMGEILPRFWAELSDDPAEVRDATPEYEDMVDLTTGKTRRVVPVEDWHLLAPIPGVRPGVVDQCVSAFGWQTLMVRIYVSGTGWRTGVNGGRQLPGPTQLEDMYNPVANQRLRSVILPCLKMERLKADDSYDELFGSPSAKSLRNLLGEDWTVLGTSVFVE